MLRKTTGAMVALIMMIGPGPARGQALTIEGTSTVRSWSCATTAYSVTTDPAEGYEDAVLRGDPAVDSVTVRFAVGEIDCGNDTMEEHLRRALKAGDYPEVVFRLSRYAIENAPAAAVARSEGELTIAGETRSIQVDVTVRRGEDGKLHVEGEQEILMTDYAVKPPSLMLGVLKVAPEVTVKFHLPLTASTPARIAEGAAISTEKEVKQ